MPNISNLKLLNQLPKNITTIILSIHNNPTLIKQTLNTKTHNFLSKHYNPNKLITTIHTITTNNYYLTPNITIKLTSNHQNPLTKHKHQITKKLTQKITIKKITTKLNLSPKTIHIHHTNLIKKLNINNNIKLTHHIFNN